MIFLFDDFVFFLLFEWFSNVRKFSNYTFENCIKFYYGFQKNLISFFKNQYQKDVKMTAVKKDVYF